MPTLLWDACWDTRCHSRTHPTYHTTLFPILYTFVTRFVTVHSCYLVIYLLLPYTAALPAFNPTAHHTLPHTFRYHTCRTRDLNLLPTTHTHSSTTGLRLRHAYTTHRDVHALLHLLPLLIHITDTVCHHGCSTYVTPTTCPVEHRILHGYHILPLYGYTRYTYVFCHSILHCLCSLPHLHRDAFVRTPCHSYTVRTHYLPGFCGPVGPYTLHVLHSPCHSYGHYHDLPTLPGSRCLNTPTGHRLLHLLRFTDYHYLHIYLFVTTHLFIPCLLHYELPDYITTPVPQFWFPHTLHATTLLPHSAYTTSCPFTGTLPPHILPLPHYHAVATLPVGLPTFPYHICCYTIYRLPFVTPLPVDGLHRFTIPTYHLPAVLPQ